MIVSERLKYVYVAIPRTASKSMNSWLVEHFHGEGVGHHHQWDVPAAYRDFLVFTVVRNPYERVVSMEFHVPWGGVQPNNEETRVVKPPPQKPAEPLSERLRTAGPWGDGAIKLEGNSVPEVAMNQWSYVRRAGVSLVLHYERLPRCLRQLPFVNGSEVPPFPYVPERGIRPPGTYGSEVPPFPYVPERGIRPPGTFFDHKDDEDEQVLWAYASGDFEAFGYRRHDPGLPDGAADALWIG